MFVWLFRYVRTVSRPSPVEGYVPSTYVAIKNNDNQPQQPKKTAQNKPKVVERFEPQREASFDEEGQLMTPVGIGHSCNCLYV
jgi:hypothetical protein